MDLGSSPEHEALALLAILGAALVIGVACRRQVQWIVWAILSLLGNYPMRFMGTGALILLSVGSGMIGQHRVASETFFAAIAFCVISLMFQGVSHLVRPGPKAPPRPRKIKPAKSAFEPELARIVTPVLHRFGGRRTLLKIESELPMSVQNLLQAGATPPPSNATHNRPTERLVDALSAGNARHETVSMAKRQSNSERSI